MTFPGHRATRALLVLLFVGLHLPLTTDGAALSGNVTGIAPGTNIDLTAEGTLDWAHWGSDSATSFNHRNGVAEQITNFTLIGPEPAQQYTANTHGYSWTNGTPTAGVTNTTTGVLVTGLSNGFQFTVPAGTLTRRLTVYAGVQLATGRLQASLNDASAGDYLETSLSNEVGATNAAYVLDFAAASTGQVLTVRFTADALYDAIDGFVSLQAATLALPPNILPTVTITSPTNDAAFVLSTDITVSATASDSNGAVTKVEFFADSKKIGQATNVPYEAIWSPQKIGIYPLTAVATDDYGATKQSSAVVVFVTTGGGSLSGTLAPPVLTVDLAAEGTNDWAHWGLFVTNSFNHKAGVTPLISNYTVIGNETAYPFADNYTGYSWSDGTPTLAVTNTITGVYVVGTGNGFEVRATADTNNRSLKLHVGTYGARGKLLAYLSDFSGPVFSDASIVNPGNGPGGVYTLNYAAASPGKTLIAQFTVLEKITTDGNVTLQAATVSGGNAPPTAAITSPVNNTSFVAPAGISIGASAMDPDGSVAKVEFFQGATKLGEATSSPYGYIWNVSTPGLYALTVKATDNGGATYVSAPVNVFVGIGGGILSGSMTTPPPTVNLSTEGRQDWAHWGLESRMSFNQKIGGGSQISNFSLVGQGLHQNDVKQLTNSATAYTWTDGTQNLAVTNTATGIYLIGLSNGFQISVPAGTNLARLKVYAGLYSARGRFQATLSDFSAPPFIDTSLNNIYGDSVAAYAIKFAAASPGKSLVVRYTADAIHYDQVFGNVVLEAATLLQPLASPATLAWDVGGFGLSVATDTSFDYVVEFTDSLTPATWQVLTNVSGTGSIINLMDADAWLLPQRFYRVRTQ